MKKYTTRKLVIGTLVPFDFDKNKKISDALSKWSSLSLEQKIEITGITNEMYPKAAEPIEQEIEMMKGNKNFYGSSIGCWLIQDTEKDIEFYNKFVATILQTDKSQSLDDLQYEGKDIELDAELKKKIEDYRRDRS